MLFTMAYHIIRPGTTALRRPYFPEMKKLAKGQPVTFEEYKIGMETLKGILGNYTCNHNKPITKSLLTWWAFQNENQELPALSEILDVEHIFSRNRKKLEAPDMSEELLESIGNKSLLERTINIRASDYKFADKKAYYEGKRNVKNGRPRPTIIQDLLDLGADRDDFGEDDIKKRRNAILGAFMESLERHGLMHGPDETRLAR